MPAVPSKISLINFLGNVEEVEVLCGVRLEWHLTTWRVRRQVLENIFTGEVLTAGADGRSLSLALCFSVLRVTTAI